MDVADLITELGGNPRSDEDENVQLLVNEIVILREKVKQAEQAEGRCERKLGQEIAARTAAETRARAGERVMQDVEASVARSKREALAAGAPLRLEDETRARESLAS